MFNTKSDIFLSTSCGPQGGHLLPLLFSLTVNSACTSPKHSNYSVLLMTWRYNDGYYIIYNDYLGYYYIVYCKSTLVKLYNIFRALFFGWSKTSTYPKYINCFT